MKERLTSENFHFMYFALAAKNWYVPEHGEKMSNFVLRLAQIEDQFLIHDPESNRHCIALCNLCIDEVAEFYRKRGIHKNWDTYINYHQNIDKYMNLYKTDLADAVVHYTFSILMHLNGSEIDLPLPTYGKGLPRLDNKHGMTYAEMNRKANLFFTWGKA